MRVWIEVLFSRICVHFRLGSFAGVTEGDAINDGASTIRCTTQNRLCESDAETRCFFCARDARRVNKPNTKRERVRKQFRVGSVYGDAEDAVDRLWSDRLLLQGSHPADKSPKSLVL